MNTKFTDMSNLGTAVELTRQCLCDDKELPVKVEAAIGLQSLIEQHEAAYQYIQPNIKQILLGTIFVLYYYNRSMRAYSIPGVFQ